MKKFGVGVGIIVLNTKNEVLILLRNEDKFLADSDMGLEGTYTLPSGKIKCDETFEQAAVRKVNEETSLVIKEEDLAVISLSNDINEYAHYTTIGLVTDKFNGDVILPKTDEFVSYRWFSMESLPDNLCLPSKKIINNYLNKKIYNDKEWI